MRHGVIVCVLQEEFVQQMEEVREAYEEEKHGYQSQNAALQEEIDELQAELEKASKHRKSVEEMKRGNNKLLQEKRQVTHSRSNNFEW